MGLRCTASPPLVELIDTLWNVNLKKEIGKLKDDIGINRYIMECKLELQYAIDTPESGINRYIMECKFSFLCLSNTA